MKKTETASVHNPTINARTTTLVPDFSKKRRQVSVSSIFPFCTICLPFIYLFIHPSRLFTLLSWHSWDAVGCVKGSVRSWIPRRASIRRGRFNFDPFRLLQCSFLKACASRSFCNHGGHLQCEKQALLRVLLRRRPSGSRVRGAHRCLSPGNQAQRRAFTQQRLFWGKMGNKQTIFTDEQLDAYQVSLAASAPCMYEITDVSI